jgi:branched-chain amino acid transport system permease protein
MRGLSWKQICLLAVVLILLLLYPLFVTSSFPLHIMIMVFLFGMMGVAWNIIGGYAGMFSFGQVVFFGIGAYTSSYLFTTHHISPWIGLLAGGAIAALAAALIGIPCSKLRGHYFSIASIAFAEIIRIHFNNWKLINAAEGISLPMVDEGFRNFEFHTSKVPYYYILLAFLIIALLICTWVSTSRMGFYFRAIKESHELAKVLGINFVRYRLAAIMISAFITAAAGTFYAQYILYIDPESVLILPISVQIVLVTMLGGAGSIFGPVIGAAILLPLAEGTRVWMGFKGSGLDMIVYGTLIMLISVYQPGGVWGFLSRLGSKKRTGAPPAPALATHAASVAGGSTEQVGETQIPAAGEAGADGSRS